ncbi:MAG: helix-turn-helix domain-containing protein [Prevotella sp.]|nr:helix-turn-helix domain-containing protein [Prevotella sp.]
MVGNFIMLQKEDLKAVVAEVVEEILGCRKQEVIAKCCRSETERELVTIEEEYYTRELACKHLHISTTKLWRMEKDGVIAVYKIGRRSLYSKKAVDELIKSNYRAMPLKGR